MGMFLISHSDAKDIFSLYLNDGSRSPWIQQISKKNSLCAALPTSRCANVRSGGRADTKEREPTKRFEQWGDPSGSKKDNGAIGRSLLLGACKKHIKCKKPLNY
jgi:hypothetical protein